MNILTFIEISNSGYQIVGVVGGFQIKFLNQYKQSKSINMI